MRKIILPLLLTCMSTVAVADNFKSTKDAIDYRQAAFSVIAHQFSDMGAMIKGKKPFDEKAFAMRAENLVALSKLPLEGFVKDSDKGNTDAKQAIWLNKADFDTRMTQFQQDASELAKIAISGDKKAMKKTFSVVAKTCKNCHKEYKNK